MVLGDFGNILPGRIYSVDLLGGQICFGRFSSSQVSS